MNRAPYRFSMLAYPPDYRAEYGGELVGTALDLNHGVWSARQSIGFLWEGTRMSARRPRRYWPLAVIAPLAYSLAQVNVLISRGDPDRPELVAGKSLAVLCLPILVYLIAERVAERPSRWRTAAIVWVTAGFSSVAVVSSLALKISQASSNAAYWRLWPTDESERARIHLSSVDAGHFDDGWGVGQIVGRELVAVIVIALLSSLVLRVAAGLSPSIAAAVVPTTIFLLLAVYVAITPWAFVMDYDFFVGDSILGATFGDLLLLPVPMDPVSGVALGVAATSMGGLLLAWGGPIPIRHGTRRRLSPVDTA